jgi:hypothetical protein
MAAPLASETALECRVTRCGWKADTTIHLRGFQTLGGPVRKHRQRPRMAVLDAVQFAQRDAKHAERAGSAPEH